MFEQYKVFVKIKLINEVSAGLMAMSGHFAKLNKQADVLNAKLGKLKTIGLIGAGVAAGGVFGLVGMAKSLDAAEEYTHQLNVMNIAGMKHKSIVEATAAAWKTTQAIPGTTPTSNLKTLLDLRNVLGTETLAQQALPFTARMQMVLAAVGGKNVDPDQVAFSMAKALDVIGATKNTATFKHEANLMTQVVAATQGRVTPYMFQQTFAYARQARYGMDDAFKYGILPSLMLEYSSKQGGGGGSRGVGPTLAALYRLTNQGYIAKASLPILEQLGLVKAGTSLKTTTTGTTVGGMKDAALAASDPFRWVQQVVAPAIAKKFGSHLSKQQIVAIVGQVARGNQLAAGLIDEFLTKPYAFYRDELLMGKGMTGKQAYAAALGHDPHTAFRALSSAWTTFEIAFGMSVVPILVPALIKLARGFNELGEAMRRHQAIVKAVFVGLTSLFVAMAVGGTVLAVLAAFAALVTVLGGGAIGATIAGLVVGVSALGTALVLLWGHIKSIYHAVTGFFQPSAAPSSSHMSTLYPGVSSILSPFAGTFMPHAIGRGGSTYVPNPDHAQHEAQPAPSTSNQGAIYLDSHEVGKFFFNSHDMNQFMYQSQLNSLNRFNASLSPTVPDATFPH